MLIKGIMLLVHQRLVSVSLCVCVCVCVCVCACRSVYGDQALGEANLEMITIARKV